MPATYPQKLKIKKITCQSSRKFFCSISFPYVFKNWIFLHCSKYKLFCSPSVPGQVPSAAELDWHRKANINLYGTKNQSENQTKNPNTLCNYRRHVGGINDCSCDTHMATCHITFHNYLLQNDWEAFGAGSH